MTDELIPEALAAACKSIGDVRDCAGIAETAVRAYLEEARRIRRERIKAGIARARKHGTRSGKPIGSPPVDKRTVVSITLDIVSGHSLAAIARRYGVGESTVRRIRDGKHPHV